MRKIFNLIKLKQKIEAAKIEIGDLDTMMEINIDTVETESKKTIKIATEKKSELIKL
ncbi:MAG: hypothetical protein ACK52J_05020 [bacterium]